MLGTLIIVPESATNWGCLLRLGASAVEVGVNQNLAAQYAKRTKAEQYGIYLMYNLPGKDSSAYISAATQELYGRKRTIHQLFQHLNIISCLQAPTCKELKASLLQAGFWYLERIVLHKRPALWVRTGKELK